MFPSNICVGPKKVGGLLPLHSCGETETKIERLSGRERETGLVETRRDRKTRHEQDGQGGRSRDQRKRREREREGRGRHFHEAHLLKCQLPWLPRPGIRAFPVWKERRGLAAGECAV